MTDEVFWVWQGMWYRFGITIDDTNVTVSPPTSLCRCSSNSNAEKTSLNYER